MKRLLVISIIVGVVILLCSLLPLLVSGAAAGLAGVVGCTIGDAVAPPCLVGGGDIGGLLNDLSYFGLLGLVTLPIGLALLGLFFAGVMVYALVKAVRSRTGS